MVKKFLKCACFILAVVISFYLIEMCVSHFLPYNYKYNTIQVALAIVVAASIFYLIITLRSDKIIFLNKLTSKYKNVVKVVETIQEYVYDKQPIEVKKRFGLTIRYKNDYLYKYYENIQMMKICCEDINNYIKVASLINALISTPWQLRGEYVSENDLTVIGWNIQLASLVGLTLLNIDITKDENNPYYDCLNRYITDIFYSKSNDEPKDICNIAKKLKEIKFSYFLN